VRAGCSFTAFSTFICSSLDDGTRYLRRAADHDCDASLHKVRAHAHPRHLTCEAARDCTAPQRR
jgi:hypothetical protein